MKLEKPTLNRAISDGTLNRRILRMCHINEKNCTNVTIAPAHKFIDFLKGMAVLREQYVQSGIADANRSAFLLNEGLIQKGSALFLARAGDEVLGTISVIAAHNRAMPCMKLFEQDINALGLQQRKVVEVGTLSVKKHPQSASVVFRLYRKVLMYAIFAEQVDDIFIQVKDQAAEFYMRNFLFTRVGDARPHPDYCDLNVMLLRADVRALRERIYDQKRYGSLGWLKIIRELGLRDEYRSVCKECTPAQRFIPDEKDAEVYRYLCSL